MSNTDKIPNTDILARIVDLKTENDGKRIILVLEKNSPMKPYYVEQYLKQWQNKNVALQTQEIRRYFAINKLLQDDEDKCQQKII
jgi:hypothetical protein